MEAGRHECNAMDANIRGDINECAWQTIENLITIGRISIQIGYLYYLTVMSTLYFIYIILYLYLVYYCETNLLMV